MHPADWERIQREAQLSHLLHEQRARDEAFAFLARRDQQHLAAAAACALEDERRAREELARQAEQERRQAVARSRRRSLLLCGVLLPQSSMPAAVGRDEPRV